MSRLGEPVLNSLLCKELVRSCPKWQFTSGVERTGVFKNRVKRPDLTIRTEGGNIVVLEAEFMPARTVEEDAVARLGESFHEFGESVETVIALRFPESLREIQGNISEAVRTATYEYCVFSRSDDTSRRWPESGWLVGGLRELANCIDLVSISESLLSKGTNIYESVVLRTASQIREATLSGSQIASNISGVLHQTAGEQTYRMAAAILTNATVFHEILSRHFDIATLDQVLNADLPDIELLQVWHRIVQEINYLPIFQLALDLLSGFGSQLTARITRIVISAARELSKVGITNLYDLSGRMFQKLIADRKFLATFYTLPSSSALLAELALASLPIDWRDTDAYSKLRIADLACGTGTLIAATYRGILKRYEFLGNDSAQIHSDQLCQELSAKTF